MHAENNTSPNVVKKNRPQLTMETRTSVIKFCNAGLIHDKDFHSDIEYHSDYYINQFSFLSNQNLSTQLGEAFYQARFVYKLMFALQLTKNKSKGIIKFQIIQYASICEALLNYTIDKYFKEEFAEINASVVYTPVSQALSEKTIICHDNVPLTLCKQKREKAQVTRIKNTTKAEFAFRKGIISEETMNTYCSLYDLRNNAHLLKAATVNYYPRIIESQNAYKITWRFIADIKKYYKVNP